MDEECALASGLLHPIPAGERETSERRIRKAEHRIMCETALSRRRMRSEGYSGEGGEGGEEKRENLHGRRDVRAPCPSTARTRLFQSSTMRRGHIRRAPRGRARQICD
jgi:hypothetical protein